MISNKCSHPWNRTKKGTFQKGHTISEETRKKIGLGNKGKKMSDKARKQISKSLKGRIFSQEHKKKIGFALHGHKVPLVQKQKQSRTMKSLYKTGKIKLNLGCFRKGQRAYNKDETLEETFGKEKAKKIKEKISRSVTKGRREHPEIMIKIRRARMKQKFPIKNTSIERAIFSELQKREIKFTKHKTLVYNDKTKKFCQPDAFIEPNICIFADGDYWHKRTEKHKQDIQVNRKLRKQGFKVLRFWGHQINKDPRKVGDTISKRIKH